MVLFVLAAVYRRPRMRVFLTRRLMRRIMGNGLCDVRDIAAALEQLDPDNLPELTPWPITHG